MRRLIRTMAMRSGLALMSTLKVDRWLAGRARWRGAVLMMHRVRPARAGRFQPNRHLEITPEFLDTVLARLVERRIPVVCLEEAADRLARGHADERFAAITLDDGYRDNLQHAAPVIRRHAMPYTVFVATGMIDGAASAWWMALEAIVAGSDRVDARHAGAGVLDARGPARKYAAFDAVTAALWRLDEAGRDAAIRRMAPAHGVDIAAILRSEMMDWDEVRRLAADPLCRIGGHTVSHPALAMLPEAEARAEIVGGLDRIEAETGARPRTFAYPYGSRLAVGPREEALVGSLGLKVAVTTARGMLTESGEGATRTAWPRLSLNGRMQTRREFDLLLSGVPFLIDRAGRHALARLRPPRALSAPGR